MLLLLMLAPIVVMLWPSVVMWVALVATPVFVPLGMQRQTLVLVMLLMLVLLPLLLLPLRLMMLLLLLLLVLLLLLLIILLLSIAVLLRTLLLVPTSVVLRVHRSRLLVAPVALLGIWAANNDAKLIVAFLHLILLQHALLVGQIMVVTVLAYLFIPDSLLSIVMLHKSLLFLLLNIGGWP
jgi:hypothetical protein